MDLDVHIAINSNPVSSFLQLPQYDDSGTPFPIMSQYKYNDSFG